MVRMAYACLLPFDRAQMMGVLDSPRRWKSDYRKGPISVSHRQISRESIRFTRIFRVSLHHRQPSKIYSFVFAQSIPFYTALLSFFRASKLWCRSALLRRSADVFPFV